MRKTMEIVTRIENGKAYLSFDFTGELGGRVPEASPGAVLVQIKEHRGRVILQGLYPLAEEEPAGGILLHPHLWNGLEDPYQYQVFCYFINSEGKICDSSVRQLAIYALEEIPQKGWLLNGKAFAVRAVSWDVSRNAKGQEVQRLGEEMDNILRLLVEMGSNTLYFYGGKASQELVKRAWEKGFVVWEEAGLTSDSAQLTWVKENAGMPECADLFANLPLSVSEDYYGYKARWSREPFVHICMNPLKKTKKHTLSLTVYSNQKKVALYTNGTLFEFLTGGPEYYFEEIPLKNYPLTLTAEAGECRTAITLYETSHNFHKIVTFS